jgi:hypothetical protein
MGTDRSHEFTGPCICGKGTLEIKHCTPDHGWPVATQEWYETNISCTSCRATYELQLLGKMFYLVAKTELAKIEAKKEELYAAEKKLRGEAKAKGVLSALAQLLDNQSSLAAVHRLLSAVSLEHISLETFRKRWGGGTAWVGAHISGYNIGKVLTILDIHDPELVSAVTHLEQLSAESNLPPTPIEPPIYELAQ